MGRFFRSTSDTPIDYMYRINTPLMSKVLLANDQGITNELEQGAKARSLANFNYVPQDQEEASKVQQQIEQQADSVTSAIQGDYANWKKQLPALRQLKQSIMDNYTNGPISKYQSNYNARKAASDAIDKQVNLYNISGGKKGVSQVRALMGKQYADSQFTGTGYDAATKHFNTYNGISMIDDIDVQKRLSEGLEKMKNDGELKVGEDLTKGGQYFNKQSNKWEGVTQDRILGIVNDRLNSDPQLMDYFRQNTQIGYSKGIFDSEGKFMQPFSYTPVDLAPDEQKMIDNYKDKISKLPNGAKKQQLQQQLDEQANKMHSRKQLHWNENSELSPIIQGIVRQFSYSRNENKSELKNNSLYNAQYSAGQAWQRQTRSLTQADDHFKEAQKNIMDRFNENMDWNKEKFYNPQAKGTTGKTGKTTPVETGVSKLPTNSFENLTVPDPNNPTTDIPYFSTVGLSSTLDNSKAQRDAITKQLNSLDGSNPDDRLKIQELTTQAKQLDANIENTRSYYNMATDAVLQKNPNAGSPLSDNDVKIYNEFSNDRQANKFRQDIVNLRKQYPDINDPSQQRSGGGVKLSPQVETANARLSEYLATKKRVDNGRDQFLANIRRSYITTDAIVPNEKEGTEVKNMLLNNYQGSEIFENTGKEASGTVAKPAQTWSWSGDKYTMSFKGSNNLADYIEKYNVGVDVMQIGGSTSLGKGNAVVRVKFKDPNGVIPGDKSYYISVSPELQKSIAGKFSKNKNPDVAKIANSIGDDEANSIRNQVAQPDVHTLTGHEAPEKTIFLSTPTGTKVPLYVTEIGQGHITVQYDGKDGTKKFIPRVGGGVDGYFNGVEDFIEQWKAHKALLEK